MNGQAAPDPSEFREVQTYFINETSFTLPKRYQLIKMIGSGAYGVVCSALDLRTNQKVAIKKIKRAFRNINQAKRNLREIKIMRHCQHNNVLQLIDIVPPASYEAFQELIIVTELLDTDLYKIIASKQPLSNDHCQFFIYQILRGLKYLHSANILHRDLKPSNLLINANCELQICDFGLAREASSNQAFLTEYVATRWYRAPEIILSWTEYTKAIDVWSVGCIFAELLGRRPLFQGRDHLHQLSLIIDVIGTPSKEDLAYIENPRARDYMNKMPKKKKIPFQKMYPQAPPPAIDLLERMLTFSPTKRITVDEALKHPYLQSYHDPTDEPVADANSIFDFSYEEEKRQSKERYKDLLWQEICHFHPELEDMDRVDGPSPAAVTPSEMSESEMPNNDHKHLDEVFSADVESALSAMSIDSPDAMSP